MLERNGISGPRPPSRRTGGQLVDAAYDGESYYEDFGAFNEPEERFDPLKLLLYVVQYRWLIGTLVVVGLVSGLMITFMQTPKYLATAEIEVMPAQSKVLADLNVVDQTSDNRAFETARARLMSRDVARRVVSALGLSQDPTFLFPRADFSVFNIFARVFGWSGRSNIDSVDAKGRDQMAVGAVLGGVSVNLVPNTSILSVSYSSPDPKLAADVANQLVKSYMDQQVDQTVSTSDLARQYVQQEVDDSKDKLAKSEQALVDYAKQAGITVSEKDGSLIGSNIQAINTSLAQVIQDRLSKQRLAEQIDAGQGAFLPQVMNSQGIQTARNDLAKLKADYQEKLATFKPSYPEMLTLAAQATELQKQLDQEIAAIENSVKLDYQDSINKETDLRKKLDDLQTQQVAFQDKNIQYTILNREVESNRARYTALEDKLNSLGVSDLKQPNINVVDAAVVPGLPYSPRLSANLLMALALGLAGSAAIIYVRELFNNKFNIPDQIETDLKLPVLGIVPRIEAAKFEAAMTDAKSSLSEAYRSLRTSLQFTGAEGAPKILCVTSAEPGESKSTTAIKLAEEFGAIGVKVLLIDTDMRRPSLHRFFKADNTLGLSNMLTGTVTTEDMRQVFQDTQFPNVTFLSSGPLAPNPADLLSSQKMSGVLHACAKRFDMIILDGPPVIGLSDAPILARLAEATLMVVSAHQVARKSARAALKRLRATGGHVIGATLSMFAIDRVEYSYAYRYMNDGYYGSGNETPELEDKRADDGGNGVADKALATARAVVDRLSRRLVGHRKRR